MQSLTLDGNTIYLEPLQLRHYDQLYQLAQDEVISRYLPSGIIGADFERWFNKALAGAASQQQMPFVVFAKETQAMLGTTRLYEITPEHKRCVIGYTWYTPSAWGTAVNPECKLLLLTYVFEQLNYNRAEFFVDSRNARSRAAVLKLGAKHEGTLRAHMVLKDGHLRNTEVFSIIHAEWQSVKAKLMERISDSKS